MTFTIAAPTSAGPTDRPAQPTPGLRVRSGRRQTADVAANVGLLGLLWFAYAAVRNLPGDTRLAASANAVRLLGLESALRVDVEAALQSTIDWPQALVAANTYYLLHFPLTLVVMAVAFRRSRTTVFAAMRNSLVGCTAVALTVHLVVPMAPPRLLPGFVDAGAQFGPDPYALAGSGNANQFAAMPSMHVAWAILAGYAIWQLSPGKLARVVGIVHPLLTSFVVVVTGHHFVFDVAIGAGVALVALALVVSAMQGGHRSQSNSCRSSVVNGSRKPVTVASVSSWSAVRTSVAAVRLRVRFIASTDRLGRAASCRATVVASATSRSSGTTRQATPTR